MQKSRSEKVVCYIVHDGWLVTFTHDDIPIEESGVQVPAGTIKPGESAREAALREALEETGLHDVRVIRELGETYYDISPYRHEIMHRHFFELTTSTSPGPPWAAGEADPESGGDRVAWTCRWIPLEQAHVLACGLGALIGEIGAL